MAGTGKIAVRAAALSLGLFALMFAALPSPAIAGGSSEFRPCLNRPAPGDEGEVELTVGSDARTKLARSGLETALVRPARWVGVFPIYPVKSATDSGERIVARLAGGFVVRDDGGRRVRVVLTRFVREAGSIPRIEGRIDGAPATVFRVSGITVRKNLQTRFTELDRGRVTLAPALARKLKSKVGARGLTAGSPWGRLYLSWKEATPPEVSTPDPPPPFLRAPGATDLAGATLTWRVREKWIQYVAGGSGSEAVRGALPGAQEVVDSQPPLVYEYSFPFASGWVKDGPQGVESASVEGEGGVYFRNCGTSDIYKGINFTVHSPEIEIQGGVARLIFTVEGIDATPFQNARVVLVNLTPTTPERVGETTTWQAMPGGVPLASLGIFGSLVPLDYTEDFGSFTLSIDRGAG